MRDKLYLHLQFAKCTVVCWQLSLRFLPCGNLSQNNGTCSDLGRKNEANWTEQAFPYLGLSLTPGSSSSSRGRNGDNPIGCNFPNVRGPFDVGPCDPEDDYPRLWRSLRQPFCREGFAAVLGGEGLLKRGRRTTMGTGIARITFGSPNILPTCLKSCALSE